VAADQFIARPTLPTAGAAPSRPADAPPAGAPPPGAPPPGAPPTILAGFPWLREETRNTLIALPGLTLGTGRPRVAVETLRRVAGHLDEGALPDRLPDTGDPPGTFAADTSLWFVEALRVVHTETGNDGLLRDLCPAVEGIVAAYGSGTRHGVYSDPDDGLLAIRPAEVPRTWMNAMAGPRIVTPRFGKPIEVNALWYNALRCAAGFARRLGTPDEAYAALADRVSDAFARYWDAACGYCLDVLDGPGPPDFSLRPNQLLAVSLFHSPLPPEQQRAVVDQCARRLYTPHGLRSLAPDSPAYRGQYGGDPRQRSEASYQGTAWSWLIGPFIDAHLRVYNDPGRARSFLAPLLHHTAEYGLSTIGELFDGDAPFRPRGRFADARAVANVLYAWIQLARASDAAASSQDAPPAVSTTG
jgi:predicted glycogen debranching enzyme